MKVAKINAYYIPDSLLDFSYIGKDFRIETTSKYVTMYNSIKQGLNLYDTTAKFTLDGIRFRTISKSGDNIKVFAAKELDNNMNYVVKKGTFKRDGFLSDLLKIAVKDKQDRKIIMTTTYDKVDDSVIIDVSSPESLHIEIKSDGSLKVNGENKSGKLNETVNDFSISAIKDNQSIYNAIKNPTLKTITLQDTDTQEYYLEFDVDNETLTQKNLKITNTDNFCFGDTLMQLNDSDIWANVIELYDKANDTYPDLNQYVLFSVKKNLVQSFSKSRVITFLTELDDNIPQYDYGFFKTSESIFLGYVYISSSYAYITYYKAKAKKTNSCEKSDDTSLEIAVKFKIKRGKGISIIKDNTAKTVIKDDSAAVGDELLKNFRKGAGVFCNSLFNLKKYKDDGSKIEITYNYTNSKNYYKIEIYDENTRYKIVSTKVVNGDSKSTTKYVFRYKTTAIYELKDTHSLINIAKKVAYDLAADSNLGVINYSATTVGPLTVSQRGELLLLNPNTTTVKFPRIKGNRTYFGRVYLKGDTDTPFSIIYQPTTGVIYAYNEKDKTAQDIDTFKDTFNKSVDRFKIDSSCDYAKLEYKDLDGKDKFLEFPMSCLFIAELLNGTDGLFYRIYYKNAEASGVVEATKYNIKE